MTEPSLLTASCRASSFRCSSFSVFLCSSFSDRISSTISSRCWYELSNIASSFFILLPRWSRLAIVRFPRNISFCPSFSCVFARRSFFSRASSLNTQAVLVECSNRSVEFIMFIPSACSRCTSSSRARFSLARSRSMAHTAVAMALSFCLPTEASSSATL